MKPVKFVLLATSAVTFLAVFALAYINSEGVKMTLWELRKLDVPHAYIIMGALGLPLLFSGLALKNNALPRWQSIISFFGYAIALFIALAVFSKTQTKFGADGALGAKLIVVALGAGLLASLVGSIKPERAAV